MGDKWFEDLIALMDDIHDPSPRPAVDWKGGGTIDLTAEGGGEAVLSQFDLEEEIDLFLKDERD